MNANDDWRSLLYSSTCADLCVRSAIAQSNPVTVSTLFLGMKCSAGPCMVRALSKTKIGKIRKLRRAPEVVRIEEMTDLEENRRAF